MQQNEYSCNRKQNGYNEIIVIIIITITTSERDWKRFVAGKDLWLD